MSTTVERAVEWDWADLRRAAVQVASGVLRSSQDAEDAAQEAIVRAWRASSRCEQADDPRPWIARIAHNEALRLGGRISDRRHTEGTALDEVGEPGADPYLNRGSAPDTLTRALGKLQPRDRELVRLRYVEDLQYSGIAERLDLPLGTVKVRLHRLHAALRKAATP
jgi:RNA polymerase sigma-70 factor (ECF subfamily)